MPKCRFCHHANPAGVELCRSCGAWIEQAVPSVSAGPAQGNAPAVDEPVPDPRSLEDQVLALMQGRKKIEAIKLYRQETGTGLKEAKDFVEALAAKHGIAPKGAGCAGMVLLMVAVSTIIGIGAWIVPL